MGLHSILLLILGRTRYVHHIKKAYAKYIESLPAAAIAHDAIEAAVPLSEWIKQKCLFQPQADFWIKSMELDLLIL